MTNVSRLVTTQPLIAHGPCSMVTSKIKISLNTNSPELIWILTNKNTHQWNKTLETWENSQEDSSKKIPFFWLSLQASTPRIKISSFKSSERTNKASSESEMEREKWSSETVQASLKKNKLESSEVSLKSERTKTVRIKSLTTTLPHCSDFQNGLLTPKLSSNKNLPCKSKNKLKCTQIWTTLTLLLWVIFYLIEAKIEGKKFFIRCEVFNVSARSFK